MIGRVLLGVYVGGVVVAFPYQVWAWRRWEQWKWPGTTRLSHNASDWLAYGVFAFAWPVSGPQTALMLKPWRKPDPTMVHVNPPNGPRYTMQQALSMGVISHNQARAMLGLAPTSAWSLSLAGALNLPSRQQVEPIKAWKLADLVVTDEGVKLRGVGYRVSYGPNDQAKCNPGYQVTASSHAVPEASCTCGFYALRSREEALNAGYSAHAVLEVELFGKVIKHERGYRAERQRVLAVHVLPSSAARGGLVVLPPALDGDDMAALERAIAAFAASIKPGTPVGMYTRWDNERAFSLADLSNELGVEVTWDESVTTPRDPKDLP